MCAASFNSLIPTSRADAEGFHTPVSFINVTFRTASLTKEWKGLCPNSYMFNSYSVDSLVSVSLLSNNLLKLIERYLHTYF